VVRFDRALTYSTAVILLDARTGCRKWIPSFEDDVDLEAGVRRARQVPFMPFRRPGWQSPSRPGPGWTHRHSGRGGTQSIELELCRNPLKSGIS
jgi:hypothetical protein